MRVHARPDVDWEKVEAEYRAGQLTLMQIARLHNVSHPAIIKRAKKGKWTRNFASKVSEEVTARLVTEGLRKTQAKAKTQAEAVETAIETRLSAVRLHYTLGDKGLKITQSMLAELEAQYDALDDLEQAVIDETKDDQNGLRRAKMLSALSLSGRAQTLDRIATAAKSFVAIERQALNLDDERTQPADPVATARADQLQQTMFALLSNLAQPAVVIDQPRRLNGNGHGNSHANGGDSVPPEPEDWPK